MDDGTLRTGVATSRSTDSELPRLYERLLALSRRNPRRVVRCVRALWEQQRGAAPAASAWAAYSFGVVLVRAEQLSEALPVLQAAEDQLKAAGLELTALHARRARLSAMLVLGDDDSLEGQWEQLADRYERLGSYIEAARARFDQVAYRNKTGRAPEALGLIEQLEPLVMSQGTTEDHARILRLRAVACRMTGRLDQAQVAVDQSLARYRALHDAPAVAKTLFERSIIHQRREQFADALDDLAAAQTVFRRLDNPLWFAFCAMEIGLIATHLGQYDRSIRATSQARSTFAALGLADYIATCDLNLGNVAYYSGLLDLAQIAYRQAEAQFGSLGRRDLVLVSRRNQALVLGLQGHAERAASMLDELVPLAVALGDQVERAELLLAQGMALRDLGKLSDGLLLLTRAEEQFQRLGNRPAQATCQLEQGWLLLEQQQLTQATRCFQQVELEHKEQPAHLWRGFYGLGVCAERQGAPDLALQHYQRACAIVAELRRALASEHASSAIFSRARALFQDTLRLAEQRGELRIVLQTAEQFYSVALERQLHSSAFLIPHELQASYAARQRQLQQLLEPEAPTAPEEVAAVVQAYIDVLLKARHINPSETLLPAPPLSLEQIQARCSAHFGADWTILYYLQPEPHRFLIVSIDTEQIVFHPVTLSATAQKALSHLTTPASLFYTLLDIPFKAAHTSRPWDSLAYLGAELIPQAVREKLQPGHRLLVVPSERLQRLPWAALRLEDAWLIERTVVQLVPSLRIWSTLIERAAASTDALLIGVGSFNGRAQPLASVRPSLELVARVWPGRVSRLTDEEVTRQKLLAMATSGELRAFGLLHIATHGQVVASNGLLAHLKLSSEDFLYADVARLSLDGALVVLAACDGAAGEALAGEEMLSLSRALIVAGARDVVASTYPLYDNGVLKVLQPLYERLARGDDAPTALAYAQRQVINQGRASDEPTFSPLVWASFGVMGAGVVVDAAGGTRPTADTTP